MRSVCSSSRSGLERSPVLQALSADYAKRPATPLEGLLFEVRPGDNIRVIVLHGP